MLYTEYVTRFKFNLDTKFLEHLKDNAAINLSPDVDILKRSCDFVFDIAWSNYNMWYMSPLGGVQEETVFQGLISLTFDSN